MKFKSIAVLAILLIVTLGFSSSAGSGQVVKNSYEDSFPHVKGDYLVWQGNIHGDWEILLYNIATQEFCRVTDNDYGDVSPQTDGKYVVWLGFSRSGGEIFLYDVLSRETTQITDDRNLDSPPQIANGRVVWGSCEVTDSVEPGEIFLYDLHDVVVETKCLSESLDPGGTLDDSSPRINEESVMWVQDDGQDTKVVVYKLDTGKTTVYPQGFVWEDTPQTDGDLTVFTRHDGNDREIFVRNSSLRTYEQVTDNDLEDRHPCVSGNNITWAGGEGQASEIFLNADIEPINTDFDPDEPDSPSTSGPAPQGSGGGGGGGCFIATAAFGSPMEKHVTILRSFKDTYLLPRALGRIFIRIYNKYSPPLAHFIAKHDILKVAVRISLLPLVAVSYATLHFGLVITLSILVAFLILPIFVTVHRRDAEGAESLLFLFCSERAATETTFLSACSVPRRSVASGR